MTLVVTNDSLCSDTATAEVTIYTITSVINSTNSTCFGVCDGSALVFPSGGTQPYYYYWSQGAMTDFIPNLCSGNYAITVSDANGCTTTNSVNMLQPPELIATIVGSTPSCDGQCTGTAGVYANGGVAPYMYAYDGSPLIPMPQPVSITGFCPGSYVVIVEDAIGCQAATILNIDQTNQFDISMTIDNIPSVDTCDGSITANVSGGTSPYSFGWCTGATGATISQLCAGFYAVTVSDNTGCTNSASIPIGDNIIDIDIGTCFDENGYVPVNVTTNGCSGPYYYIWSTAHTDQYVLLQQGQYAVTVYDNLGNVVDGTVVIPLLDTCSNFITGHVFKDDNNNCLPDSGETPLSMMIVRAEPGGYFRYTDFDGYYSIPVDTGTYTVFHDAGGLNWFRTCPDTTDHYTVQFAVVDENSYDNNFSYSYNIINGFVYDDENENCVIDSAEAEINNMLIRLDPGPLYTLSDQQGYYEFLTDTGTFYITLIENSPILEPFCPTLGNGYDVGFSSYGNTATNNFGLLANDCALLRISVTSGNIRPCFSTYFYVHYWNEGLIPVYNAEIEIEFDPDIVPQSSSLPWSSQNGNTFTFIIDSLGALEQNSFNILVYSTCDMSLLGHTACTEAHIYPDTLCEQSDPLWDHSSLQIEGSCMGDSLACFTITNTSDPVDGDMQGQSEYRLFSNDTLILTEYFQLSGGDSLNLCFSTFGNALRLVVDQRPGHPGNSHPQQTIEDCGDYSGTSLGFVNSVPQDDAVPFVDIYCMVFTGSYDPNDKAVVPEGLTPNHYVDSTADLEYTIRFQNTGTDTAFTVVIRDTLSSYLEISTVTSGSTSHPYQFTILGQGVLQWTFENIQLPDSNVNEPASHGFVSFRVNQQLLNPVGTTITNRAGIIFDFNPPIITNTTSLIVWELPLVITHIPEKREGAATINLYPNPAKNIVTFEILNSEFQNDYSFVLFDAMGKEIQREMNIITTRFNVSLSGINSGIYFYQIYSETNEMGSGKIIVE